MDFSSIRQKILIQTRLFLNQTGLRKKKIFAIGFNKSGTTSLHALFTSLGLPSYHGVEWRSCENMKLFKKYDCFSDDVPKDLQKLDTLFPDSKFILQVRDLESWVYSRFAHIEREKNQGIKIGLEWDVTEYAVKSWIKKRNAHHLFVLSYFSKKPSDLIIVNYIRDEKAATKIANFLGYEGDYERPRENVKPPKALPNLYSTVLNNALKELNIPVKEAQYDIYCPSLENSETQARFPVDSRMIV